MFELVYLLDFFKGIVSSVQLPNNDLYLPTDIDILLKSME